MSEFLLLLNLSRYLIEVWFIYIEKKLSALFGKNNILSMLQKLLNAVTIYAKRYKYKQYVLNKIYACKWCLYFCEWIFASYKLHNEPWKMFSMSTFGWDCCYFTPGSVFYSKFRLKRSIRKVKWQNENCEKRKLSLRQDKRKVVFFC